MIKVVPGTYDRRTSCTIKCKRMLTVHGLSVSIFRSACASIFGLRHRNHLNVASNLELHGYDRFLKYCSISCYSTKSKNIENDHRINLIKVVRNDTTVTEEMFNEKWIPPKRPSVCQTFKPVYDSNVTENDRMELDSKPSNLSSLSLVKDGISSVNILDKPLESNSPNELQAVTSNLALKERKKPDWLTLRRNIFGYEDEDLLKSPTTNGEDVVLCKMYTLLSADEIFTCVESFGGKDITLALDRDGRMGGPIGMILVTANNVVQMNRICDLLVYQLRRRKLHECNVVGATSGIEGKARTDKVTKNNNWLVVDCGNYIVHVQDEETRQQINLESLWSGSDPLFRINCVDEDEIEDYLLSHPLPQAYNVTSGYSSKRSSSFLSLTSLSVTDTIHKLHKSRCIVARPNETKGKSKGKSIKSNPLRR